MSRWRSIPAVAPLAALALALLTTALPAAADPWAEAGDAGPLPASAQTTVGSAQLTVITGALGAPDDVDMYCIQVQTPATLVIELQCVIIQGPNIWLFDATGKGVAANSTCVGGGKRILSTFVSAAGKYYVAVAYNGVNPYAGASPIWVPANTGERAPDGSGAAGAVTAWIGTGQVGPINPYQINLTGTGFCDGPVADDARSWGGLKASYH